MRFAKFSILLLMAFAWCFAQEINATLTGTVTDTSGGLVSGASVVVHSDATNTDVRTVSTDSNGAFTVTNLPAGSYSVTVKVTGFRSYSASNVILNVAQKRSLSIELQPGQVSETVTVTETAAAVQTASAAQLGTVSGTQVRELQLNNRNFQQLVTLQPGVASGLPDVINFGISNVTNVVVNGARVTSNNWTVDGADINDSGSNGTLLNVPSVDAIQEFTLGRSNYDAQYGRSGGGQVLTATKSGTDKFHGDLYEFVRNDYFNANNFFSNLAGRPRPTLRYNDYGFTVGGPLFVPKLYKRTASKTFFFWSEEWRKTGQPSTLTATVPTAAQLAGTFTGNLTSLRPGCVTYNGNTSQILPACFSKNAQAYITNVYSKFPGNASNGSQYISNVVAINNYRQDLVRLDQNITDKVHIFGRYMQDTVPTTEPGGLFAGEPLPGISSTATNAPGKNVVANVSWAISPTVVNEAAFNYSWGAITSTATGITNSPAFVSALSGGLPYTDPYGRIPGVTISGFSGVALPSAPYNERNIDKNFYDNFSKVFGSHTIRAGITVQWMTKTENGPTNTAGSFTFQTATAPGSTTSIPGSAFANFLLGNAASFTQASRDIIPHLDYTNIEAYLQDDWRVSSRFTVNLGLRYSYFPPPSDSNNLLNNFDPTIYNPARAPLINPANGNFVAGQGVVPSTYVNGIIFPQGAACSAAQAVVAAVTCSPYGSTVNPSSNNNFGPRVGFAYDPTGEGKTAIRAGYGVYYDRTLNGLWEQNAFTEPPILRSTTITNTSFDQPLGGTTSVPLGPASFDTSGRPDLKVPSYQDWNFSVEQQLLPSTVFQIAYVGTKGTHLLGEVEGNQPSLAVRQANPTVNVNAIRPYLGYSFFKIRAANFDSNYNSLQVSLNRRVSHGLNLGVSYTWSKNLTDNSADRDVPNPNSYDYRYSYGPANLNTPHIFITNFVYELPFFRTQQGFVGHLLGGWEISGIATVESGQSLNVRQGSDPFNSADWGGVAGTYPGGIGIDPSPIAPRADLVAGQSLDGPKTVLKWFNTAAFTNAVGHFGTAGRGILLGPHYQNWDMAGIRNFKFGERVSMQLRGEFFNAFNHTNFTQAGLIVNFASPTYGQVTAAHNPRNIQLGLKLYF